MNQTNSTRRNKQRNSWFRRHRFITLLLFNVVLLVGVFVVFEVGLRVFTPDWLSYRMDFLANGARPDDFGTDRSWKVIKENGRFVKFVPHSRFDVLHAEYQETATIDDLGGRTVVPQVSSSGKLIGCLGDSFTFGVGVASGETFVDHLQRDFSLRLVNLGVPGSALPQQRFIVEARHSELGEPPLYLEFFFLGNDFEDILNSAGSFPNPRPESSSPKRDPSEWTKLTAKLNDFLHHSWLRYSYSLQFLKRAVMQATGDERKNPIFEMMNVNSTQYHEKVRKAIISEIEKWKMLASEKKFRFVIIFVPDCHQLDDDRRKLQAENYGLEQSNLDPLLPNRVLSACLDEQEVPYIDPTGDLVALPGVSDLYYVNDNHFTVKGHSRFAESIAHEVSVLLNGSLAE